MLVTKTVVIANGASLSEAVGPLDGLRLVGIQMPATWTSAELTFDASVDGLTYQSVYDAYGELQFATPVEGTYFMMLDIGNLGWIGPLPQVRYLKVRSGTAGTPVAQGAARTLTLVFEAIHPYAWGTRG